MRMYDIIEKKRNGNELNKEEIDFFISGYVKEEIPDYQVSALLMAICINGMTNEETSELTKAMLESGEKIDLSAIPGIKVDKHSTGGVGDKTTLIVLPIVSVYGVHIPKMSGRGLGYTGGTIDKLESVPGFKFSLDKEQFFSTVNRVGFSITHQSGNLVPADKKIYALRDVTATVESIPLIASSIMSKKLALGSDCILLDVKTGRGAFMKDFESSLSLAKTMVEIGKSFQKETVAIITDMDSPLGNAVGNSLEVIEACETLKGKGPEDLTKLSIYLAANMLYLAGKGSLSKCKELASNAIQSGTAFLKFKGLISEQGGDTEVLDNYVKFPQAKFSEEIVSDSEGYINNLDAEKCGLVSVILGAGRENKDSEIDLSAGILFNKKRGDYIKQGDTIAKIYSSDTKKLALAKKVMYESFEINKSTPAVLPLIQARVTKDGIERFIR